MNDNFAFNLKRLRSRKRLTLEQLAEQINKKLGTRFNKGMLSKWENGLEAHLDSIVAISCFFEVTIDELLGLPYKKSEEIGANITQSCTTCNLLIGFLKELKEKIQ